MSADIDRFRAVRKKFREVTELAYQLYQVDLRNTKMGFGLRGKVAGWAGCKICNGQKIIDFRFNREMIQGKYFQEIMDETVAHEVAHGVCFANPKLGKGHNDGWRRVCIALGGNGKERHNFEVTYANGGYDYITSTGFKINISAARHSLIQNKGKAYLIGRGKRGKIDRYSRWARGGQPIPEIPPTRKIAEISWPQPKQDAVAPPAPRKRVVNVDRGSLLNKIRTTLGQS